MSGHPTGGRGPAGTAACGAASTARALPESQGRAEWLISISPLPPSLPLRLPLSLAPSQVCIIDAEAGSLGPEHPVVVIKPLWQFIFLLL